MPGPWITDAELRGAMAHSLKVTDAGLAADAAWPDIITESNQSACDDITSILLGRGYTIGQIDLWDRRVEFNKDLGRYWSFVRGNCANTYSDVLINKLDRRKDLEKVVIMTDGILILPGGGSAGEGPTDSPEDDIDGGGSVSGGRFNQEFFTFRADAEF